MSDDTLPRTSHTTSLNLQDSPDVPKAQHFVPSSPVPARDFAQVRHDLEQTFLKLKTTKDPDRKQALFRQLRLLLREMHHLAGTTGNVAA